MLLKEFFVSLGLDTNTASFATGMASTNLLLGALEKVVEVAKEAVQGFVDLVKTTAEYGKETSYTAEEVGLSTQALQELRGAAVFTGVGVERLDVGIFHLARSMNDAAKGTGEQSEMFQKLGIKVKGADGKIRATDDVIGDFAEKISAMPDGLEKTGLMMEAFGRSGARLIPIFNKGREGLAAMRAEAYVMSPEDLENSKEVANLFDRIAMAAKSLLMGAIAPLMPEIKTLLKNWLAWKKLNEELLKQRLKRFFHDLIVIAHVLARGFQVLTNNSDLIAYSLLALGAAFLYVKLWGTQAAAAVTMAWIEAAAPFLLIAGLVAGFLLIFDDIRQFALHGDKVDSLTGRFVKMLDEFTKPKSGDPWWLKTLRDFADTLREAINLLHELNGEGTAKGMPASGSRVTSASPMFKKLNAMVPKTQAQIAREQTEEVGGRMDVEAKAGWAEGLIFALTRPSFDYRAPGDRANGGMVNNIQINANGLSKDEAQQVIDKSLQSHWDGQMQSTADDVTQ